MARPDISPYLVHFTKGHDDADAFDVLRTILREQRLLGGNGGVRGGHQCVCFTESPLKAVASRLVNHHGYTRYSPFGVMFAKSYIYEHGGRPVIYGGPDEYDLLRPELQWRHVRYEPSIERPIDFTWEREWRLRAPELTFEPRVASIVVPNAAAADRLREEHMEEQDMLVQMYSQIMDANIAEQYRDEYQWRIVVLDA